MQVKKNLITVELNDRLETVVRKKRNLIDIAAVCLSTERVCVFHKDTRGTSSSHRFFLR